MKMHELKTVNPYFSDIWDTRKSFEIRKDDRGFQQGDILWLREYEPNMLYDKENDCLVICGTQPYSGREILCMVSHILPAGKFEGLATGYCCMEIKVLQRRGLNYGSH